MYMYIYIYIKEREREGERARQGEVVAEVRTICQLLHRNVQRFRGGLVVRPICQDCPYLLVHTVELNPFITFSSLLSLQVLEGR